MEGQERTRMVEDRDRQKNLISEIFQDPFMVSEQKIGVGL
jgi:hypothetical protein